MSVSCSARVATAARVVTRSYKGTRISGGSGSRFLHVHRTELCQFLVLRRLRCLRVCVAFVPSLLCSALVSSRLCSALLSSPRVSVLLCSRLLASLHCSAHVSTRLITALLASLFSLVAPRLALSLVPRDSNKYNSIV